MLKRLLNNIQYKIAALMLAFVFWYMVQGEQILEINRSVQVQIEVPDGHVIRGDEIRIKDATIRGTRALIGDMSNTPLEAMIKVSEGRLGRFRVRLTKKDIKNWDDRLKITIHDAYLNIWVDEKMTRTVPITEQLQGVPADGFIIEKAQISPASVTVTGLKSEITKLRSITTEPIDITGIQKTQSFEVPLAKSTLGKGTVPIEKVKVSLQVGEKKINKRFGSVPIQLEGAHFKTSVSPRFVTIVVQGTPGVLSFIKKSDLKAYVPAIDLKPGVYQKKIQVKIPPNTALIETFPENIKVEVSETSIKPSAN